ncbi:MAG: hypothetical protein H7240_09815 [Glaciimonas sp.]|nr:hypothetical protein [Glaciimonas sp.]
MDNPDQRYLVRQRKIIDDEKGAAVYAKMMKSKSGTFEGVSFIRNKDKASVMTLAEAQQVIDWATAKKDQAKLYVTTIICKGQ